MKPKATKAARAARQLLAGTMLLVMPGAGPLTHSLTQTHPTVVAAPAAHTALR
jgi:hypothetical protein